MTTFWCESAWLGDTTAEPVAGVVVHAAAGRFATVTTGVRNAPRGAVALRGLTLPGIANGHSHAFHRAFRGRTHGGTGDFWSWRTQMYAIAERLTPDTYLDLATATYAEMVVAGFTAVGEFHYLHHQPDGRPYADPNAMSEALFEAARRVGIRITLLDTCYLHGGLSVDGGPVPLNPVQRRFSDGSAQAWAARAERARIGDAAMARLGAAVHSVRAVDPASIAEVGAWALANGAVLHAHVSEQPLENEQCAATYGRTPIEVLHDSGALTDRFTAVHATHLTDADVVLMGAAACTCCMCPTTERDLADGIGPTAALRTAGVALSIGTDAHSSIDPFEEMRAVEHNERLRSLGRGTHQPRDLLQMAGGNGYRSIGWPDGGRIEVGALADFVTVGTESVRLVGTPAAHELAAAVFAASSADVTDVVIGGEHVVRQGGHRSIDVVEQLRRALAIV